MIDYAWRELVRRKRRTLAQTAGFATATAIITLVLAVLANSRAASDAVLSATGTHFTAFIPLCSDESCGNRPLDPTEGFFVGATQVMALTPSYLTLIRTLDTVADAAPFLLFRLSNRDNPVTDVLLGGLPLDNLKSVATNSCSAQDVVAGRFLTPGDRGAAVLEEAFARSRYLKTGDRLRLGSGEVMIVGVVNTGIRMARSDVYLPLEEARALINTRLRVPLTAESSLLLVESKNANAHAEAVARVKRILGGRGSIASYNCSQPAAEAMGITDGSAFLITFIIFLCLVAVSLQAQYGSVIERRYDIGILVSIGWSRRRILAQIIWESFIKAGSGWLAGNLIATAVFAAIPSPVLMGTQNVVQKALSPPIFLFTFILAAAGGAIAGLLPGLFAASQKPADCLRRL